MAVPKQSSRDSRACGGGQGFFTQTAPAARSHTHAARAEHSYGERRTRHPPGTAPSLSIELRKSLAQQVETLFEHVRLGAVPQTGTTRQLEAAARDKQDAALLEQTQTERLIVLGDIQSDERCRHALGSDPAHTGLRINPRLGDLAIAEHDLTVAVEDLVAMAQQIMV